MENGRLNRPMDELTIEVDGEEVLYLVAEQYFSQKREDKKNYKEGQTETELEELHYHYLASKLSEERVKLTKEIMNSNNIEDEDIKWKKMQMYREEAWRLIEIGYKENPDYWEALYFKEMSDDIVKTLQDKKSLSALMFYVAEYSATNHVLYKTIVHPKFIKTFLENFDDDWGMLLRFFKAHQFDYEDLPNHLKNNPEFLRFILKNIREEWHRLPDAP